MILWLAWAGCDRSAHPNDGDEGFVDPDAGPGLALESPAIAAFLEAGVQPVVGQVSQIAAVSVNATPAPVVGGHFATELALPVGMTTLEAEGTDGDGILHTDNRSVLAGTFSDPSGSVVGAVRIRIGAASFAELGPLLGDLLDPAAISQQLVAVNPVVDTAEARVDLAGASFDTSTVVLTPQTNALAVDIRIPNFAIGIDAVVYDALPFGFDLELSPDLRADEVRIRTTLGLAADGAGGLDATLGPLDVELVSFDLDTGILELVDWLFVDDQDLADTLERQIALLGADLGPAIDAQLANLDLATETEMLGATLTVGPTFDAVVLDPTGLTLDLGIALDVSGPSPDVPGHLTFPAPPLPVSDDVAVQISDGFLNRALFELWAGGALDLTLPLDADDAAILFVFGGTDTGTMSMRSALPPVWIERDGVARLQMGELALTVETPGGKYGEVVELIVAIDAAAEISVDPEAAGIVLSNADVKMRAVGDSAGNAALAEALPGLATAFGIGIGAINEQLSFPLDAGVALPPMVFLRDPSGLGTVVELSISDLLGAATGTTTSTGLVVSVPGTAQATDGDDDISPDGVEVWVCPGDEVVAEGDNGVWYVEDGAEVRIEGTGHTVHLVDGGTVVLETGGNTVQADPGATVEDNDGTNTITVYDPLEFDRSGAQGC